MFQGRGCLTFACSILRLHGLIIISKRVTRSSSDDQAWPSGNGSSSTSLSGSVPGSGRSYSRAPRVLARRCDCHAGIISGLGANGSASYLPVCCTRFRILYMFALCVCTAVDVAKVLRGYSGYSRVLKLVFMGTDFDGASLRSPRPLVTEYQRKYQPDFYSCSYF